MENWLDKYKPSKIDAVLGDKHRIEMIDRFVKLFNTENNRTNKIENANLIISGPNGVGKTLIVDLIIKENGFEKVKADLSNISICRKKKKKKKKDKDCVGLNRNINTFYMMLKNNRKISLENKNNNKIVLVIDDVSNISNPKEKEAIKSLIKVNGKFKCFPIIIIANKKHSKMLNELRKLVSYHIKDNGNKVKDDNKKKIINEIIIKSPAYGELEEFVKKISSREKINLVWRYSDDPDIYQEIIEHSQYDVRRLINILEELKFIYGDSKITVKEFQHYSQVSKTKDIDPGIFEATRTLLNNYTSIDNALFLYSEERTTIPLMVHENYPLNIRQQYPKISINEKIDMIYEISKSLSESDRIDGIIYSNQCWNLQSVHGFYSCALPSYYINRKNGKLHTIEDYKYTQDYNKTSIKKINNKVIKKTQEHPLLKKVYIYDFLYVASILKSLLERKDYQTVANLMKPYKLKLKEIESIIKIDKIKKNKIKLTGKQKNIIRELLGEKVDKSKKKEKINKV